MPVHAPRCNADVLLGPLSEAVQHLYTRRSFERLDLSSASRFLAEKAGTILAQLEAWVMLDIQPSAGVLVESQRPLRRSKNSQYVVGHHQILFNDASMVLDLLDMMPLPEARAAVKERGLLLRQAITERCAAALQRQNKDDKSQKMVDSLVDKLMHQAFQENQTFNQRLVHIDNIVRFKSICEKQSKSADVSPKLSSQLDLPILPSALRPWRLLHCLHEFNSSAAIRRDESDNLDAYDLQIELDKLMPQIRLHEQFLSDINSLQGDQNSKLYKQRWLIAHEYVLLLFLKYYENLCPWNSDSRMHDLTMLNCPNRNDVENYSNPRVYWPHHLKEEFLMLLADLIEFLVEETAVASMPKTPVDQATNAPTFLIDGFSSNTQGAKTLKADHWLTCDERHLFCVLMPNDKNFAQRWNIEVDAISPRMQKLWHWLNLPASDNSPRSADLQRIEKLAHNILHEEANFSTNESWLLTAENESKITQIRAFQPTQDPAATHEAVENLLKDYVELYRLYPQISSVPQIQKNSRVVSELRALIHNLSFMVRWPDLAQDMRNFNKGALPLSSSIPASLFTIFTEHKKSQITEFVEKNLFPLYVSLSNASQLIKMTNNSYIFSEEENESYIAWADIALDNGEPFLNRVAIDGKLLIEQYKNVDQELKVWLNEAQSWHSLCSRYLPRGNPQIQSALEHVNVIEVFKAEIQALTEDLTEDRRNDLNLIQDTISEIHEEPGWLTHGQACVLWLEVFNRDCDFSAWPVTYENPSNPKESCQLSLSQRLDYFLESEAYPFIIRKLFAEVSTVAVVTDGTRRAADALESILTAGSMANQWANSPTDGANEIKAFLRQRLKSQTLEPFNPFSEAENCELLARGWKVFVDGKFQRMLSE